MYTKPNAFGSIRMMLLALEDMVKVLFACEADLPDGFTGYDPKYPLPVGGGGGGNMGTGASNGGSGLASSVWDGDGVVQHPTQSRVRDVRKP